MFHNFTKDLMCSIPSVFYPTTVFLVDDDKSFLQMLSLQLRDKYSIRCFSDANLAIETIKAEKENFNNGDYLKERFNGNALVPRKEVLNPDRFKRHMITVLDQDMPNMTGAEGIKNAGRKGCETNRMQFYILFTATQASDLKEMKEKSEILSHYEISKFDKDCVEKLKKQIDFFHEDAFQFLGYNMGATLTRAPGNTSFFFVWEFLPIWNAYIKEHDICEGYLFDSQGSMMFLDRKANLSWFIVRNEYGITHGIEKALEYGAPEKIVNALTSKEYILSLYEDEDFNNKQHLQWDKYLLKANVFKDEALESSTVHHRLATYYYAFTSEFPEHGVPTDDILSYEAFLKKKD